MTFGSKLQSLREAQSLSQKELAGLVSVSTGIIAEWEADETMPGLAELSRLSKALGVSSDVLLDATAESTVTPSIQPTQEAPPVVVPVKRREKTGFVIGTIALCAVLLVAGVVLWSQGVFTPEPLLFAEDTARIEAADASVVTIFCYDYDGELAATGSGFVAFDGKTIITNYHVMTSAYTCKISTNQDISYEVSKILCYSKDQDIAILQLAKDTDLQPLTLGDSSIIKKGETVVAIGSPLGIKNTVSTGNLSGRLMDANMDVLQFTAPISSGSSGGALFDNNGNVIGITFASYVDGQNLNLAIPIELAVKLYDNKGGVKSVSTIYTDEHPYVSQLSKYKDIPSMTIEEFLQNYQQYNGQTIKITGYISSFRSVTLPVSGEVCPMCYIAPRNRVSGDGEFDKNATNAAGWGEIPWPALSIWLDGDDCFLPATAQPGDMICVIGRVTYREGSGSISDYLGITEDLVFSPD